MSTINHILFFYRKKPWSVFWPKVKAFDAKVKDFTLKTDQFTEWR
jgi:hypothetical protein